jgi:hypothetical protein
VDLFEPIGECKTLEGVLNTLHGEWINHFSLCELIYMSLDYWDMVDERDLN